MNNYSFDFNPKDCNKIYFSELSLLLNNINPEKEHFERIKSKKIKELNIKCENDFNSCKPDEFFFENKKQIILGRFFDTIGCFYKCKGHYFSMAMEPYSLFKNDVFIRYIIDKPELYINNSKKVELEKVFPIRIVLSDKHNIPTYASTKIKNMKEYTFDDIKKTFAVSNENSEIINNLPDTSILKKIITEKFPINHIISRELCILYYMKLHFYLVENKDKTVKPFILVSKYNLKQIKELYKKHNKKFPNIQKLFDRKTKTIKKKGKRSSTRKRTSKNI
tara:strand:- start:79 stop:912 length:834 start_codon:yes stop_codon:yes gene_type:complete